MMFKDINIVDLKNEINNLKTMISKRNIVPILGAGFSMGSKARNGFVPSAKEMEDHMFCEIQKYEPIDKTKNISFSKLSDYYNNLVPSKTRKQYLIDNFLNVELSDYKQKFLLIPWLYIYSLNIDDSIEKNSRFIPIDLNAEYEESLLENNQIVFKLHGNATRMSYEKNDSELSVFDTTQYIRSLNSNKWILNKLRQDYIDKNMLFLGCSLTDEIDLLYSYVNKDHKNRINNTHRYYVTDRELSKTDLIDIEKYGITDVLKVNSYDEFYDAVYKIEKELREIPNNALSAHLNLRSSFTQSNDIDYVLYGKSIFSKRDNKIVLPKYYINRNIVQYIIDDYGSHNIQIVYGKRVSGKTYVLAGVLQKTINRDVYYFPSNDCINKTVINNLIAKRNIVVLIDTNAISRADLEHILSLDKKLLISNSINFVVCVNTSKKEDISEVARFKDKSHINLFYLDNYLSNNEFLDLKQKMSKLNIPYFKEKQTFLDNIIRIQQEMCAKNAFKLKDFYVAPENYLHFVFLILLAYNGRITSSDMVLFELDREPYEIMPKLSFAAELDYRNLLFGSAKDNDYFQIVCNATVWLLQYLSEISLRDSYFDIIANAICFIVKQLKTRGTDRNNKELYNFIRFDNLNMLLSGARYNRAHGIKRLIQSIYTKLKPDLCDDYQFNHQHAKCLLWGIECISDIDEREALLDESLRSAIIAKQQVEDLVAEKPHHDLLKISLAHINFTISMIKVKNYYFSVSEATFVDAVEQLYKALSFEANQNAEELFDTISNDNYDYSISKFIDGLVSIDKTKYSRKTIDKINKIINVRFQNKATI